ncbi:hypothetical protein SD21_01605 [Treponema pallidum subsp. pallidum]|nr:hypothetical protein SD24_01620 [Treponema pallidum subsp. pallidum]ANI44245.1 hypothetical protein SD25_01610 [Treponema pallidum subsp. pallidum]ANI45211.1 hypothetical protein SD22_01600 [Treponema pallidum subsp. pallidum]ANI46179.1 hypothetical protein SD23_01605 [Treponema pallidum subsp. pallidum]ANI47146.1 hypothetical protein SD16_01605 [Treponema pallidum subsp. pallidum]
MVIRPPCLQLHPLLYAGICQRTRIITDCVRIGFKSSISSFTKRNRLCCHHMWQRAAEHKRTALIHRLCKFFFTQNKGTAWPAQRFVCGTGHDMRPAHWILVSRKNTACNQSSKVSHISHEYCAHFVCNFPKDAEINGTRIRAVSGK